MTNLQNLVIVPLNAAHDRAGFHSNVESLDQYINKILRRQPLIHSLWTLNFISILCLKDIRRACGKLNSSAGPLPLFVANT